MNTDHFFELNDEAFFGIEFGSGGEIPNEQLATDKIFMTEFEGLIIDGPERIDVGQQSLVPLVGLFRLAAAEREENMRWSLIAVVTDNESKETYSSAIYKPKRRLPDPAELEEHAVDLENDVEAEATDEATDPDDEDEGPGFEATRFTQFFDVDLRTLLDLPEVEADYSIFVTLGDHSSNVLRTRVVDGNR